jgi:hypothetical protein
MTTTLRTPSGAAVSGEFVIPATVRQRLAADVGALVVTISTPSRTAISGTPLASRGIADVESGRALMFSAIAALMDSSDAVWVDGAVVVERGELSHARAKLNPIMATTRTAKMATSRR